MTGMLLEAPVAERSEIFRPLGLCWAFVGPPMGGISLMQDGDSGQDAAIKQLSFSEMFEVSCRFDMQLFLHGLTGDMDGGLCK